MLCFYTTMFLYLALTAQLLFGASATTEVELTDTEAFAKMIRMADPLEAVRTRAREAAAHNEAGSRNLRDSFKPADLHIEKFLDASCTVQSSQRQVQHGNYCNAEREKVGCVVSNGQLLLQFASYSGQPDCSGTPSFTQNFPFEDDNGNAVVPGQCMLLDNEMTRAFCSNKDQLRNEQGLHING